jgi:hypothetical protein
MNASSFDRLRTTRCVAALVAAASISACGGSPNTPGGPIVNTPGGSDPPPTNLVKVHVKVTIPSARGGIQPGYISSKTQSLVIQLASVDGGGVTGVNATTIETFRGAHACSNSGGSTVCSGTTDGSPGNDVFSVTTYSGRDATGGVLSVGAVKAQIGHGGGSVSIDSRTAGLDGVIASLELSLDPNHGKRGDKMTSALTLSAYDASGAQITGSSPFEIPIALTIQGDAGNAFVLHAGGRHGTSLTITKPTDGITLSYDGDKQASSVTVAATVNGPSSINAGAHFALKGKQPPPPVGTIYALNFGSNYGQSATVTEYDGKASGDAAPVRTLQLDRKLYARSIAVDTAGNLYVGYYDNQQGFSASNGTPDKGNVVYIYPPGASGNTGPSAILTADKSSGTTIFPVYMAFDPSGNFVTYGATNVDGNNGNDAVLTYAPLPSGPATPLHGWNFASPQIRYAGPTGLTLDGSGNFYVNGALHTSLGPAYGLYTNLAANVGNPSSTPARTIPWDNYTKLQPGLTTNVALDDSGEILIGNSIVVGGSGSYACQGQTNVFSAGAGGGTTDNGPLRLLTLEDVYTLNYQCSSPRSPLSAYFPSIALYGTSLFVADDFNNAINVYSASGDGNVKATLRITGSATQLDAPIMLVITKASERAKARSVTGGLRAPVRSHGHTLDATTSSMRNNSE